MPRTLSVIYSAFEAEDPYTPIGSPIREQMFHEWADCRDNAEAVVNEICHWLFDDARNERESYEFGRDTMHYEVLIVVHSPPNVAGAYSVELTQTFTARATAVTDPRPEAGAP